MLNIINMYKHIVCTSLLLNVSWIKAKESLIVYLTLTTDNVVAVAVVIILHKPLAYLGFCPCGLL